MFIMLADSGNSGWILALIALSGTVIGGLGIGYRTLWNKVEVQAVEIKECNKHRGELDVRVARIETKQDYAEAVDTKLDSVLDLAEATLEEVRGKSDNQ